MDFISGRTLDKAWSSITSQSRVTLVNKLRHQFSSLRSLNSTYIGGVGCSPIPTLTSPSLETMVHGPFQSVSAFHDAIFHATKEFVERAQPDYPSFHYRRVRLRCLHGDFLAVHVEGQKPAKILRQDVRALCREQCDWSALEGL